MKSVFKVSLAVTLLAALFALFTLPSATMAASPAGETATNGWQQIRAIIHNLESVIARQTTTYPAANGSNVLNAASAITLTLINDSPTTLGNPTAFTATISETGAVTYTWAFGNGESLAEGDATAQHVYAAAGNYTATVTATTGITSVSAASAVTITASPMASSTINLPLVLRYPGATQTPTRPYIDLFMVSFDATYPPYVRPTVITGCSEAYLVDPLHVVNATFTWAVRGAILIKFVKEEMPSTGESILKMDYVDPTGTTDELTVTITQSSRYTLKAENLNGEIPASGNPSICFKYGDITQLIPPYDISFISLPNPNSPLTITWQQTDTQDIIAGFVVQQAPIGAGDDAFVETARVSKTAENQILVNTVLKYFAVDSTPPLCDIKYRVVAYYVQDDIEHYSPPSAQMEVPCLR